VDGLVAEAEEAAADLRRAAGEVEYDPAVVAAFETRLGLIYALERKFGPDESAVGDHARAARAEAAHLRGLDAERSARLDEDTRLEAAARGAAGELGAARREAAGRLGIAVDGMLAELGLAKARFEVAVTPAEPGSAGADAVAFMIAPNPGEPPMPLAQIASGGELSRISLAIKRVLAAADDTPTLVFDEIDAGIGGRSADPVGRSLWQLARQHQVVCVTHLPQIAAYADAHFQISKRERDGRTVTEIERLDEAGRLRELALMLAGSDRSEASLAGARELRARAESVRDGRPAG
jgi:DNA repair protein RecN (Recombination protein N)